MGGVVDVWVGWRQALYGGASMVRSGLHGMRCHAMQLYASIAYGMLRHGNLLPGVARCIH